MSRTKTLKSTRTEAEVSRQVEEAAAMLGLDLARQNTGGFTDARGQYVSCGQPGNPDRTGMVPRGPNAGARLDVEIKREGFDPAKARGEERERFETQLARLQKTNAQGGIAFWTDDAEEFLLIMRHVLAGAKVDEPGYGRPTVFYPGEQP